MLLLPAWVCWSKSPHHWRSRDVLSRDVSPCYLVSRCRVSRCHVSRFQRPR